MKPLACYAHLARNAVYALFYLISKFVRKQEISVLMYHSVGSSDTFYSVTTREFYKQIDYLISNYNVVSLKDLQDFVEGKRELPRKAVVITFDDGYLDNYEVAYPYLKKKNLPMTIFITTGYVSKKMLLGNKWLQMMSWTDILDMDRNNVDIGAHTVNHPNLTKIDVSAAGKEILNSKIIIEQKLGRKIQYFSYPFGAYNNCLMNLAKQSGFRGAVGGEGLIRRNEHAFSLNRVDVNRSINFVMFKARLTLAINWYKKLEKIFKTSRNRMPLASIILELYRTLDLLD